VLLISGTAREVRAQPPAHSGPSEPEFAVTILALASLQPSDQTYVGTPYLDKGLGGVGSGFGAGFSVATSGRLALAFEINTAALKEVQNGRLVGSPALSELRDTLYSFLAGGSFRWSENSTVNAVGGLSLVTGTASVNDVPIDAHNDPAADDGDGLLAFTVGADVARRVHSRIRFISSVRFSATGRSRRAEELGVGSHILRIGVGLQLRLNR
jgi:hypothetical protein